MYAKIYDNTDRGDGKGKIDYCLKHRRPKQIYLKIKVQIGSKK